MKEKINKNYILISFIFVLLSFLLLSSALIIKPSFNGFVIDNFKDSNGDRIFLYSLYNYKYLSITALVASFLVLVNYFTLSLLNFNESPKVRKGLLISGVSIITLLITYYLSILILIPVKQDKYNNFAWALSLASLILLLTLLVYSITNLVEKPLDESKNRVSKDLSIQLLSEGAIIVALSVILSVLSDLIPFLKLPNGGSFSLSMLPIFIFALRRGFKQGAYVGLVYSVVNFLIDGMIIHWGSIFFDYLIPYTIAGLVVGFFTKKANQGKIGFSILAIILGGFVRYLSHSLSGVIFFSMYAPEGMNAFFYSFIIYNLPYMAVSTVGVVIFTLLLHSRLITKDSRVV